MASVMTNLDTIVQTYIQDIKFQQARQVVAEKRRASIADYNAVIHKFADGTYTLNAFRYALKMLHQDIFWGAHSNDFLMELNKLANNHVPVSPNVEAHFRSILRNLNAHNVGQRIEQFYDLLTQEKAYMEALGLSDNKIVSPGNSAFIISLIAFWLDHTAPPYICYPSLRTGLHALLNAKLLSTPIDLQFGKSIEINSEADYHALTYILDALAANQPILKSGPHWAEDFFLWITENKEIMANLRSIPHNAFPYTPLPKMASRVAFDCLTQLGFDQKAIVENYKFSSTQNDYITLNALVFAHPSQRDLDDYASITMLNAVNGSNDSELVMRLAESSAPFHLIHRGDGFALWASGIQADTKKKKKKKNVRPIPIKDFIPYDRLKDVMYHYADDLKPQRIIEVKQGREIFKSFPEEVNPTHVINYAKAENLIYPDYCSSPRLKSESLFQGSKVLLQYVQEPRWGTRVKLAIEHNHYYVSEHFYVIVPRPPFWIPHMTNEVLAAILGWDVSNAWIIEHIKSPAIPTHVIDNIPIPRELSDEDCQVLTNAVSTLEKAAQKGHSLSPAALQAQDEIDAVLKKAYHLDDSTFQRLRQVTQWMDRYYITLDAQPDLNKTNWFTSGVVERVDAVHGQIEL